MKKNQIYVFFASSWSTTEGGINSFNLDLCRAISRLGTKIFVFLPESSFLPTENQENITIIKTPQNFDLLDQKISDFILKELPENSEILWIGHDTITGGIAIYMKEKNGGKSVIFHHMDYSNYYHLKNKETSEKINSQRIIIRKSDIVIGVGPRLKDSAKHIRKNNTETYSITPGKPDINIVTNQQFDYRIAICGRIEKSEDKVKNIRAALQGSIETLEKIKFKRGNITVIGSKPSEIKKIISNKTNSVAINTIEFIESREKYFLEIQNSDIVLMPSVKEGFGLVAWEAASIGIPVLVSESSGFYEYMVELGHESLINSIQTSGVPALDSSSIRSKLEKILFNYKDEKEKSLKLADLLKFHTWQRAAERFLELTGVTNLVQPPLPPVETDKRIENSIAVGSNRDPQSTGFERFEDVLSLTSKRRELLLEKTETTDFSKNQKIKFEYWATYSPAPSYFLYIHPSASIKQTLRRFSELIEKNELTIPKLIFILRKDKIETSYFKKILQEEKIRTNPDIYSLKDYIWEYCIDDNFKNTTASAPLYYIDQKIYLQNKKETEFSAGDFFREKLNKSPEFNAHLIIAPGGMGKTWFCRNLTASLSNATDNRIPVLIQAESLREYINEIGSSNLQVNSVFDLYDLYCRSQNLEWKYDRSTFELAVICGNIILIVDGLDELSTMLQERFDLNNFLESIVSLSSSLLTSHIILTTRDSLLVDDSITEKLSIAKYELLGFDNSDWKSYTAKRFSKNPRKDELISKLFSMLSSSEFATDDGRIVPFFVDILCNVIEDDTKHKNNQTFEFLNETTPYPSNNEVTDHLIHSVFRREIRRQSISLGIEDLISLITELISEQGESFNIESLKNSLTLYYETKAEDLLKKLVLNPLFIKDKKTLRLRYDFLQSYFRSIFLIECLSRTTPTLESLNAFAKSNSTMGSEASYLRKFYEGDSATLDEQVSKIIGKFKEQITPGDNKRAELVRRAISGILKIYLIARGFTSAKMSEKLIDFFPSVANKKSIDGLAIYGEFISLDFSDTTILNSKFLDYKNFTKSRFEGAKFVSCIFENCLNKEHTSDSINLAHFDSNCSLGDVADAVEIARRGQEGEQEVIEQACLVFLKSFYKSGNPFDPKPAWIKFSEKVRGLRAKSLDRLVPEYLIIKAKKGNDLHYSLSANFSESARKFIDNNYLDLKMKEFINFIK